MLGAINSMLVEMMAAIARKDYESRRERQAQGFEKAQAAGKNQGRPVDKDLHKRVTELLGAGLVIRATARYANCSTTTVLRIRDAAVRLYVKLVEAYANIELRFPDNGSLSCAPVSSVEGATLD